MLSFQSVNDFRERELFRLPEELPRMPPGSSYFWRAVLGFEYTVIFEAVYLVLI